MDTQDVMAARAALDAAPLAVDAAEAALAATVKPTTTPWKKHLVSITEQTVSTFAFTFLGLITATNLNDPTALKAAGVAGGIAVAAYLKTVAGAYLGPYSGR